MSNYTVTCIQLSNIHIPTLEKALEKVAKKLNATLVKNANVKGYSFNKQVDYLLEIPLRYGNGYGITVKDNELIVEADVHYGEKTVDEIKDMIIQEYTAIAVKETLQELGYMLTTEEETEKEKVLVFEELSW